MSAIFTPSTFAEIDGLLHGSQLPVGPSLQGKWAFASTALSAGVKCNHISLGNQPGTTDDDLPLLKMWGPYGIAPSCLGVDGSNAYNGTQDPVIFCGYNSGNGGAKFVSGEASCWRGMEPNVYDNADLSGGVLGNTHNFEYNLNDRPPNDATAGQRVFQMRRRRGDNADWQQHVQITMGITGTYGQFYIQNLNNSDGRTLFTVDSNGNVQTRGNLDIGAALTGASGVGNLNVGGQLTTAGGGGLQLGVAGVGYTVTFSGAAGALNILQYAEQAALVVKPYTANTVLTVPAAQYFKSDGTTMAVGIGQTGIQMGGTIKFTSNATLSGFGGFEIASLSGIGAGYASPAHIFYRGNGTTQSFAIDLDNNVILGGTAALATTATSGFPVMMTCAGTPTGSPVLASSASAFGAFVLDTTNLKFWVYTASGWKGVALA